MTFPYREVTGIGLHTGFSTGVLVIQTASFPGTQAGSYWSSGKNENPAQLPNAIPLLSKRVLDSWQKHLALLRSAVAAGSLTRHVVHAPEFSAPVMLAPIPAEPPPAARLTASEATPASVDLGAQLKQLAELHDAGALSDEEFAQAKAKLLG